MNKWKLGFFVVLLLGLVSNAYLSYLLVDSGISYSYLHDSFEDELSRTKVLGNLIVAGASEYSQAEILHLLRQASKDAFIVEEGNELYFEGVRFFFEEGILVRVE